VASLRVTIEAAGAAQGAQAFRSATDQLAQGAQRAVTDLRV
jgi:hypothetical protein